MRMYIHLFADRLVTRVQFRPRSLQAVACMQMHAKVHKHARTYARTHACTHRRTVHAHAHTHMCTHARTRASMHAHMLKHATIRAHAHVVMPGTMSCHGSLVCCCCHVALLHVSLLQPERQCLVTGITHTAQTEHTCVAHALMLAMLLSI